MSPFSNKQVLIIDKLSSLKYCKLFLKFSLLLKVSIVNLHVSANNKLKVFKKKVKHTNNIVKQFKKHQQTFNIKTLFKLFEKTSYVKIIINITTNKGKINKT